MAFSTTKWRYQPTEDKRPLRVAVQGLVLHLDPLLARLARTWFAHATVQSGHAEVEKELNNPILPYEGHIMLHLSELDWIIKREASDRVKSLSSPLCSIAACVSPQLT
jgi:hypothetical protein